MLFFIIMQHTAGSPTRNPQGSGISRLAPGSRLIFGRRVSLLPLEVSRIEPLGSQSASSSLANRV